ncbi:MAG: hypothetical protein JNM88_21235 [Chitinophagaceae bacterium]|nr:hypothetical protein [Chitinophagaceae bacterium]
MKKTIFYLLLLCMAAACGDAKKEKGTDDAGKKTAAPAAAAGDDAVMADWLKGKVLTGKDTMMDYHNFKLYADGVCEDKGGAKVNWKVEGGKLDIGGLMKFAVDKKDDTTLVLHRSLSDETYTVQPMR